MSCSNNNINTYLKDATIKSLNLMDMHYSNIYSKPTQTYYRYTNDPNDPFNVDFKNRYSNIQTDLNSENNEDDKFYLTLNKDDNSYVNCAIQTSIPWFTMSEDYKKCEIVKNIEYDETRMKIEKIKDNRVINPILLSKNKNKPAFCAYSSNVNKAYCENTWYDWMITPNYHFGNSYYKDNSQYSDLDVYKCYKPCSDDLLPYTTEKGEIKCIPKKYFGNGIFSKKYMFNSIVLINLIGNLACINVDDEDKLKKNSDYYQTNLLYILHRLIYEYNISNKVDKNIYDVNINIQNRIRLIKPPPSPSPQSNFNVIKIEYQNIYNEIKMVLENYVLKNFDNNKNKDYLNLNEFTYKNARFHENEAEMFTYTGMETNGILTPPILIHTWMLSQLFKPIERNMFDYRDNFYNNNGNNTLNLDRILRQTLYYKLKKIFGDKDKAIRLKNIFFKAITNCYDGKSTFSINFISATKKALNNFELLKIITDNMFYSFPNNINLVKIKDDIPLPTSSEIQSSNFLIEVNMQDNLDPTIDPASTKLDRIKTNLNKLLICDDERINILIQSLKYYKDTDLYTLYDVLLNNKKTYTTTGTPPISYYRFSLLYFEGNNIKNLNDDIPEKVYCHYLYSIEELEVRTCQIGYTYNPTVKECEKINDKQPEVIEQKSQIDDDINIPDLNNIMRIFLQFVIVAIILYLIYIIYDIFGEFILSVINYIIINFNHFIYQNISIMWTSSLMNTDDNSKLELERYKLDKKISLANAEIENINNKVDQAIEYNNEVKYKEMQKEKLKSV